MQANCDSTECPFCGGSVDDLTRRQIDLLRATVLADILPARLHDAKNLLGSVHINRRELARKWFDKRLSESLKDGENGLSELRQLLYTLRDFCRMPDDDFIIDVRDLPDYIRWMWDLFGLRHHPDVGVLQEGEGQIRFTPYGDSLTFAVHAALLSLRRDREPDLVLTFQIRNGDLSTTLQMRHHDELDVNTIQWQAFRIAVKHAGGILLTTNSEHGTSVEWHVPLVAGAQS